jgi:hypothetical protein
MTEVACLVARTGEVECVTMNVEPHELRGYLGHAVGTSLSPAILDCDCGPRSSRGRAVALRKRRPMGSFPKALSRSLKRSPDAALASRDASVALRTSSGSRRIVLDFAQPQPAGGWH